MALLINETIIEQIKEANDIVDVIGDTIELKRAGANYKGRCPFHNEKTPSFIVSPDKQIYHCFGCNAGGDVIKYVEEYYHQDFTEAIEMLAKRSGITLEMDESNAKQVDYTAKFYDINREAAKFFHENLKKSPYALNYFQKRGINKQTIVSYGLGFANDSWNDLRNHLEQKGYRTEDILKGGLIIKSQKNDNYYDRFRNRVMFPIINTKGKVIGFGGRVLDEAMPKYLNSPDTPVFNKGHNLFSLNIMKKKSQVRRLILVEGYMDVIALYQSGVPYAVASLGTALTKEQAGLMKKNAEEIFICYDSDAAGRNAVKKALEVFKAIDIVPRIIVVEGAKDPDEFLQKYGKEAFEKLLDKAKRPIEFYDYDIRKKYDLSKQEDKLSYIDDIFDVLKRESSQAEVELYLENISKLVNISKESLKADFQGRYKSKKPEKQFYNKSYLDKREIKPGKLENQVKIDKLPAILLFNACRDRRFAAKIFEILDCDDFLEEEDILLAEKLKSHLENNSDDSAFEDLMLEVENKIANQKIEKYVISDIDSIAINTIKLRKYSLNRKIKDLAEKIEETGDETLLIKLREVMNQSKGISKL